MEERQNRLELSALLETTRLLIESYDLSFVLNHLLLIIMGKLLITRAAVLIHDHDDFYRIIRKKGSIKIPEDELIRIPGADLLQEDFFYEPGPGELPVFSPADPDSASVLVTLKTGSRHIGFLCLGPKATGNSLNARERDFLQALAVMASVAIYNSQLFENLTLSNRNLDRKVQELHTLFDISREFNLTTDREQIIRVFKFALLGQMFVRTFFFVMKHNGNMVLLAHNGLRYNPSPADITCIFNHFDRISFPDSLRRKEESILNENDIRLVVPLYLQDEKVALIGVGAKENDEAYTETDGNFLAALGNLAVMSIQKTRLLEERIEKERLERELVIARTIQQRLFPAEIPEMSGLDVAVRNVASSQVGGDYFDLITDEDARLTIAIGDVTGKGVPASLIMANMQALLHAFAPLELSLEQKTAQMNDIIYKNTPPDTFVTFFWGCLDSGTGMFQYVNAGHNPPLVFHQDGEQPMELATGGLLLGAFPAHRPYASATVELRPGDLLVLYTDGITEARDSEDKEYGEDGLTACVNEHKHQSASEVLESIVEDVIRFSDAGIADDLTLMILKIRESYS